MPIPDAVLQGSPYGPTVTFESASVSPPSVIYISPRDAIAIEAIAELPFGSFKLSYRILRPDGVIVSTQIDNPLSGALLPNQIRIIPPTEGFLLSLSVYSNITASQPVTRGQTYIRVYLAPDGSSTLDPILSHVIAAGYLSAFCPLAYPQGTPEAEMSGHGWFRSIFIGPTSGTFAFVQVPANARWRLLSIFFTLTTSAVVALRFPVVFVQDSLLHDVSLSLHPTPQAASLSFDYSFAPGQQLANASGQVTAGFPADMMIPGGYRVVIFVINMDVADTITAPVLAVEEFQAL